MSLAGSVVSRWDAAMGTCATTLVFFDRAFLLVARKVGAYTSKSASVLSLTSTVLHIPFGLNVVDGNSWPVL